MHIWFATFLTEFFTYRFTGRLFLSKVLVHLPQKSPKKFVFQEEQVDTFLDYVYMYACACLCACVCVHVYR